MKNYYRFVGISYIYRYYVKLVILHSFYVKWGDPMISFGKIYKCFGGFLVLDFLISFISIYIIYYIYYNI